MHTHSHHHHTHHAPSNVSRVLIWGIILNMAYVIAEAGIGLYANSMGLVSDAGHNLSDVFSLVLTLAALKLAMAKSNKRYTYGYQKASVLISLLNALLLFVAAGIIIVESIRKFSHPEHIDGDIVSLTAGVGILINGATAFLLMRDQKDDLNIRGAFLHMAADTLVSVGVVIAGLIITFTGWVMIDPIISLVIAMLIMLSTWSMLKETVKLSIDGVPEGIDIEGMKREIEAIEGVISIHHLHVWALSTQDNAMTLHAVITSRDLEDYIKSQIKSIAGNFGAAHSTIEFETTPCGNECLFER